MTKTWKSVRDSEAYKSLSSEERDAARRQYFLDVVAPKVNTDELPDAFKQFDAETAPTFKNKVKELAGDAVDTIGESMGFGGKSPGLADTQTVPGVIDATTQPTPMTWEGINAKTRAEQAARDQARIILLEQEREDPSKTPAQLADLERELADTRAKIGVASPATEAPQVDVASTMLKPDAGAFDQLVGEKEKPDWELFDQRGFMPAQADMKKRIDAKQRLDELKAIRARTGANQITAENILTGAQKAADIAARNVIHAGGSVDAANQAGAQAAADALNPGAVEDSEKAFQRMLESAEQDDTSVASPLVAGFNDVYRAADVATSTSKAGIAKAVASALSDQYEKGMAEKVFGTQMQRAGQQVDNGELWDATKSLLGNIKGFSHFAAGQAGNLTAQIGGGAAGFALGNIPGMFTGSAAVEMTTEYGNQVIGRVSEMLSQRGQKATPQAIYDILEENPDIIAKSLVKAAGTTAIDMATTFAGMRIAAGPLRTGIAKAKLELGPSASKMDIVKRGADLAKGQHLDAAAKGMTLDIVGAGASEAIPQQMVDHNVDTAEVIGEMLLEPLFGAPTIAGAVAGQIASDVRGKQGVTPTQTSNPPTATTPPPTGPLTQSLAAAPIVPAVVPPVGAAPTVSTMDDGTGLADEAIPVDALNAEELLGTPKEERTPESFAAEIADGKTLDTPEDIQYYQNNKDAVEAELNRLAAIGWDEQSTDQATPEGEGLAAQPDQVAAQQGAQQVSNTDQGAVDALQNQGKDAAKEVATAPAISLSDLSDLALQQAGEYGMGGNMTEGSMPQKDWAILERIGLIEDRIGEDGTPYRAANMEPLFQERARRHEQNMANRRPVSEKEKAEGVERRAQIYERIAAEQESLGELGDAELAIRLRKQAADIRSGKPVNQGAIDGRGNPLQEVPEVVAPSSAVPGADLPGSGDIAVGAGDGTGMVGSSAPDMPVSGSGTDVPVRDTGAGRDAVAEAPDSGSTPVIQPVQKISIGKMPNTAEPVTVRDGVIYIGDYPAQNYDTGEDVSTSDASLEGIKKALSDAGAIPNGMKIFAPKPSTGLEAAKEKLDGIKRYSRLKPIDDTRVADMAEDLRAIAPLTGWAQRGGRMLRKSEDYNHPDYDVISRTTWIPHQEWYAGMANKLEGDSAIEAVEDAIAGRPMKEKAKRFVAELMDIIAMEREARDQDAAEYRESGMAESEEERLAIQEAEEAIADLDDEQDIDAILEAAFNAEPTGRTITDDELDTIFEAPYQATQGDQGAQGAETGTADQGGGEGGREEGVAGQEGLTDAKQQTGTPALELIGQTPEEVAAEERARAEQAKRAEAELARIEAEAKQKRIDAEVAARQAASAENLVLGQSAEDALAGQGDIFSQAEKPATNRYTPPKSDKEARSRWVGELGNGDPVRGPGHEAMLDAVGKALDAGLFYTKEFNKFVADVLGVTDQSAFAVDRTEGGPFGYEVYYARKVVEKERADNRNKDIGEKLRLSVGENIGRLRLNDGKIASASTIASVGDTSAVIMAKRGPQTIKVTLTFDSLMAYAERADNDYLARKVAIYAQTPPQAEAPQDQPSQPQELPAEVLETPVNATSSVQAEAASGVPVEKQARTLTEDGRASDGKPINPGDTFRTLSGRTTTPYPKQKSEKYASQWLIDNAIEEAKSRGDGFNETAFGGEKVMKGGGIPPASRDSMLMYLFGQQPVVVPSILKPLTASNRNAKPGLTIDDIPPMFLQKLMVKLPVLNTKTNQYQNGEANALEALTETRSDIDKMKALLNCLTA